MITVGENFLKQIRTELQRLEETLLYHKIKNPETKKLDNLIAEIDSLIEDHQLKKKKFQTETQEIDLFDISGTGF